MASLSGWCLPPPPSSSSSSRHYQAANPHPTHHCFSIFIRHVNRRRQAERKKQSRKSFSGTCWDPTVSQSMIKVDLGTRQNWAVKHRLSYDIVAIPTNRSASRLLGIVFVSLHASCLALKSRSHSKCYVSQRMLNQRIFEHIIEKKKKGFEKRKSHSQAPVPPFAFVYQFSDGQLQVLNYPLSFLNRSSVLSPFLSPAVNAVNLLSATAFLRFDLVAHFASCFDRKCFHD